MKVDPRELVELAESCLGASVGLARRWQDEVGPLHVNGRAAGDSAGGPALVEAHAATVEAAGVALGRLVATLEQTMDGLDACAFDMVDTDETEASRYESTLLSWPLLSGTSW